MRPELGVSSPVSWPISVVLPAPFGPMMACSSPRLTSSKMLSDATTPPKRLVKPSILSKTSATAQSRKQSVDTATREQHDEQQHRPENKLPIFARGHHFLSGDDEAGKSDHI